MARTKAKPERASRYNRRVICGYVSGDVVLKGYESLARRINAVRIHTGPKKRHKVTVSALAGRLLERMLPFLMDQTPETLAKELDRKANDAKTEPAG